MYQDKNSLEKFFKDFLEKEGSSNKTQKNYLTDLRDFFSFLEQSSYKNISEELIASITAKDIHLYKNFLAGQQKSESTIQRRLSSLRTFFRGCEEAKIISKSPLAQDADQTNQVHPLIHVWKGHLKEKGLPVQMSDDVQDFLLWMSRKHQA